MQIYGYCRISTPTQNIDRQIRNIKAAFPDAHIVQEVYTGTKYQGRKELDKLLRIKSVRTMFLTAVNYAIFTQTCNAT